MPGKRQDPLGWDRFGLLRCGKHVHVDLAALGGSKLAGFQRRVRIRTRIQPRTTLDWVLVVSLIPVVIIFCVGFGLVLAKVEPDFDGWWFWFAIAAVALIAAFWSRRAVWAPVAAVRGSRLVPVHAVQRGTQLAQSRRFEHLLEHRRVHWSTEADRRRLPGNYGAGLGWVWGITTVIIFFIVVVIDEDYGLVMMWGWISLMICAQVLWIRRAGRLARGAIHRAHCPHCGYDLNGLDAGLIEVPIAGPEVCPECGHEWPLVPPPTPDEIRARLEGRARGRTGD